MNEGERHTMLRARIEKRIAAWSIEEIAQLTKEAVHRVPASDVAAYVIARIVGLNDPDRAIPWIRDFAGAVAGGADDEAISRGVSVADALLQALPDCNDLDEQANTLGFLFQSYAPTAKLIDNGLQRRSDPPVLMTRRYAARDVNICGKQLRKGARSWCC